MAYIKAAGDAIIKFFSLGATVGLTPLVVYLFPEDAHDDTFICANLRNPEMVLRAVTFSFDFNPLTAGIYF